MTNRPAYELAADYSEIGPFRDVVAKYPPAPPVPEDLASVPDGALAAVIYRRRNARWNLHLHEPILVGGIEAICIGIVTVLDGNREREAAVLVPKPEMPSA